MHGDDSNAYINACLDRLRAGDAAARQDLLRAASARLTELTRMMLRGYRRLRRWEETDDVMQGALLRLHRALGTVTPPTARDFYRFATAQVRRELIDLARHYFGPEGTGRHHDSVAPPSPSGSNAAGAVWEGQDDSLDPGRLAHWTDFHRQVEALPAEERDVFELVWYQGLKFTEAAAVLDVAARTVTRRWQAACLKLHQVIQDLSPRM